MVRFPLVLACAAGLLASLPAREALAGADADSGFLAQYAATYRFGLGQPTAITPAPDGDAVLFLRSGPRSFVQDLYHLDLATGRERVLLTADAILNGADEHLTGEERARRDRMRKAARGIAEFQLSDDGRRILVALANRLFVVERATGAVRELHGASGAPIDALLSPDGARVACVRNGDLYVTDVAEDREWRLTTGANDTLSHGLAEFVAQEEMDRFSGYWWSPDSRSIAYQETNVAPVEVLNIMDPAHPERAPDARRYPRPGRANAEVRLAVVPASGGAPTWISWDRASYPYLTTVRWTKNAPLTLGVMNRTQTEEVLLAADVATGSTGSLVVERDAAWINLDPEMPRWLEDGSGFLWTTERNGTGQLELHGADGRLQRTLTDTGFNLRSFEHLDDASGVAWVQGGDDPTQRQLFRIPLDPRRGGPVQMTREPGRNDGVFARRRGVWVHTLNGASGVIRSTVRGRDGATLATLRSVAEPPPFTPRVEFFTVGSRAYHAAIVRPRDARPGVRYPVLLYVYGGPHGQEVVQTARSFLLRQWFADQGFVVVTIDGRGTPGRGRAWERAIKGDLIEVALSDQVEALQALGAEHPELDLSRVGVYGWSFGGYFSAMATLRRPDVFRAGIAGAPVVDWRDYDTFYTERYMGLPETNPGGYASASVLTYADQLERPLMIVHGTVDDNVYFQNSMKLVDALFRAGKPFEFLPLAGFTHLVPDPLVTERLYTRMLEFFRRELGGPGGERPKSTAGP